MAKAKAYLIPNVEINWSCNKSILKKGIPQNDKLHYSDGIKDYLTSLADPEEPIFEEPFYFKTDIKADNGNIEGIINWYDNIDPFYGHIVIQLRHRMAVHTKLVSKVECIKHLKILQN